MPRRPRQLCPQLIVDVLEPCSSPEPSPVPVFYDAKGGPTPVKEVHEIRRMRSINERLDMAEAEKVETAEEARNSSRDGDRNASVERPTSLESSSKTRGSRVTNLLATFERTRSASPAASSPRPYTPPDRRASSQRLHTGSERNSSSRQASNPPPERKSSLQPPERGSPVPMANEKASTLELELARYKDESQKAKHDLSKAQQQLAQAIDLRQAYEDKFNALEDQVAQLQTQLSQRDALWRSEWEKKSQEMMQERRDALQEMKSFRSKADTRESQNHGLQRQLTDLKRSISKSTRVETVVTSDSTFRQEMSTLSYEVQNWVVNHFRKAKVNATPEQLCAKLERIVDERHLAVLKPVYARWRSENKLAIFQATIVCLMMDIFQEPLLFGLPGQEEWVKALRKMAHQMSLVLAPAQYNKWRATTLDTLRGSDIIGPATDSAVRGMAQILAMTLCSLTDTEQSDAKIATLQSIVKRATTLAQLLRVQRARFEVQLPAPADLFDLEVMENTSFDVEALPGSPIECATFPVVLKLGDERGDNAQWRNVVFKARVTCSEP